MPRHCSAAGCKSRDTRETRKAGITFHRLPKRGSPRRTQWIINSQRKDPQGKGHWDPQSHFIYFCSKHFTPESFELTGVSGYRRLKDDALPTVFETSPRQRRGTSEKRSSKQVDTTRQTRRQIRSLKCGNTMSESDGQQGSENSTDGGNAVGEADSEMGDNAEKHSDVKEAGRGQLPQQAFPCTESTVLCVSHPSPLTSRDLPPLSESVPSPCQTTLPFPTGTEPASSPRPPSPSCYMKRLPPPPGFHLPREHNYAQLCPLVWRKRYDRAIDSLEKTLRLLNAARRRETRLRHTLLRLREDHLQHTLQHLRGTKSKEARSRGKTCLQDAERETAVKQATDERDFGIVSVAEEIKLICDDTEDCGEWGQFAQSSVGVVEEMGYCFYCGRGQEEYKGTEERNLGERQRIKEREEAKLGSHCRGTAERDDLRRPGTKQMDGKGEDTDVDVEMESCCYYFYSENAGVQEDEDGGGVQILTMALPQGWNLSPQQQQVQSLQPQQHVPNVVEQTSTLQELQLQVQAEELEKQQPTRSLSERALQAAPVAQDLHVVHQVPVELHKPLLHLKQVQLVQQSLATQQFFVMDSARDAELGAGEEERQVFWIQEDRDGQLLLVPVPQDDVEKNTNSEQRQPVTQPVLMPGVTLHSNALEDSQGPCINADSGGDSMAGRSEKNSGHPLDIRTGATGGDLREKLKEHLEGFQLQLSSEFIN